MLETGRAHPVFNPDLRSTFVGWENRVIYAPVLQLMGLLGQAEVSTDVGRERPERTVSGRCG